MARWCGGEDVVDGIMIWLGAISSSGMEACIALENLIMIS